MPKKRVTPSVRVPRPLSKLERKMLALQQKAAFLMGSSQGAKDDPKEVVKLLKQLRKLLKKTINQIEEEME